MLSKDIFSWRRDHSIIENIISTRLNLKIRSEIKARSVNRTESGTQTPAMPTGDANRQGGIDASRYSGLSADQQHTTFLPLRLGVGLFQFVGKETSPGPGTDTVITRSMPPDTNRGRHGWATIPATTVKKQPQLNSGDSWLGQSHSLLKPKMTHLYRGN